MLNSNMLPLFNSLITTRLDSPLKKNVEKKIALPLAVLKKSSTFAPAIERESDKGLKG